jgi:monoamine oxidase
MKALIAGGGIAGLSAARELRAAGWDITLVEARPRLGGRILTAQSKAHNLTVDLGPEFVHGRAPEIHRLIDSERDIKRLKGSQKIYWRGSLLEGAEHYDDTDKFTSSIDLHRPDESTATAFNRFAINLKPLNKALVENFVEGFNAADMASFSAHAFKRETESGGADLLEASHLIPGYHSIVAKLERELRESGSEILLGYQMTKVDWRPGSVKTYIESNTGSETREADALLLTIPTNFYSLPLGEPGHIEFSPDIKEKRAAAHRLIMGHVHKLILIFSKPLWERNGCDIEFVHSPELSFGARWLWGWVKPFMLTSWSGGRRAINLTGRTEAEILELALRDLSSITGLSYAELESRLDETHVHDWMRDPFTQGAYSYVQVDGEDAREFLAKPLETTLFFAGEATMNDGSAGTVHGAIRSGLRAAREIIQARSAPPPPSL